MTGRVSTAPIADRPLHEQAASGRTHLTGVPERRPHGGRDGRIQVGVREDEPHVVPLLETDAVLAGEHPSDGHAGGNHLRTGGEDAVHHTGLPAVEHQQRMEVAVTGIDR